MAGWSFCRLCLALDGWPSARPDAGRGDLFLPHLVRGASFVRSFVGGLSSGAGRRVGSSGAGGRGSCGGVGGGGWWRLLWDLSSFVFVFSGQMLLHLRLFASMFKLQTFPQRSGTLNHYGQRCMVLVALKLGFAP